MLVKAARQSILDDYEHKETPPPQDSEIFRQLRGVFVTLSTHKGDELRGCVGFVGANKQLGAAVVEAARLAAFEDGRFPPVRREELGSLVIEVSVLGLPQPMKADTPAARLKAVRIGKDGLIIQYGGASGLLLPQVALEWNFTPQTFLEAVCEKAGLPKDFWKSPSAQLWTFGAEIYAEKLPGGRVARKPMIA